MTFVTLLSICALRILSAFQICASVLIAVKKKKNKKLLLNKLIAHRSAPWLLRIGILCQINCEQLKNLT